MGRWAVPQRDEDAGNGHGRAVAEDPGERRDELAAALRELDTLRLEQRVERRFEALADALERVVGAAETHTDPAAREPPPREADSGFAEAPEPADGEQGGGLLVPLTAWQRMLEQLGHLHEAGQQLADARERAAKAETESGFLRERVRDLRAEVARLTQEAQATRPAPPRRWRPWRR
jgi:hypothetical protein